MRTWLILLLCLTLVAYARRGGSSGGRGSSSSRSSSSRSGSSSRSSSGGGGWFSSSKSRGDSAARRTSGGGGSSSSSRRKTYSYSSPSGVPYRSGAPIYSSHSSYVVINHHHYYWSYSSYHTYRRPSHPTVCRIPFNANDEMFKDVYLTNYTVPSPTASDDNSTDASNSTLLSDVQLAQTRYRPQEVVYDCQSDEYCCEGSCCGRTSNVLYGILVLILICIAFCLCLRCSRKDSESETEERRQEQEEAEEEWDRMNQPKSTVQYPLTYQAPAQYPVNPNQFGLHQYPTAPAGYTPVSQNVH